MESWEQTEKRLVLRHHDEHYENGKRHLVQILDAGTAIELMDKTPKQNRRAYFRSGLSNAVLNFEQFPDWFSWFTSSVLYNESYELRVHSTDSDLIDMLDSINVEYTIA
jgi:hypothetical protein